MAPLELNNFLGTFSQFLNGDFIFFIQLHELSLIVERISSNYIVSNHLSSSAHLSTLSTVCPMSTTLKMVSI